MKIERKAVNTIQDKKYCNNRKIMLIQLNRLLQ